MRKFILMFVVMLFMIVMITACGSGGGDSSEPATKTYFPTTVGSKWTWNNTDGKGNNYSNTNEITASSENDFTAKGTSSNTSDYTIMEVTHLPNGAWGYSKLTFYSNGIASDATWSPPLLIFPSKTDVATHETQTSMLTFGSNAMQIITDIQIVGYEDVNVPAGTFKNALKMTTTSKASGSSTANTWTNWFAEGVGTVKSVDSSETGELANYDIK